MAKGFMRTETPAPLHFQVNIGDVVRIGEKSVAADVIQDTSAAFFVFGLKANLMNMIKTVYNMGEGFTLLCQNKK
jgi:hypothetical protein